MTNHYDPQDYTRDHVLKTPFWLKLILAYQAKYFVILILLPLLSVVPRVGDGVAVLMPYVQSFSQHHANLLLLIPTLPALLVLIALIRRTPKTTSEHVRQVWRNGRSLLMISLIAEFILLGVLILLGAKSINELTLVILYINLMALVYLTRSQRAKDVFTEFPQTDEEAWQIAENLDSLQGYRQYLNSHTNKKHEPKAVRKIDDMLWQAAIARDDIEGYQTYLEENIKGKKHGREAREKLRTLSRQMQQARESEQF